MRMPLITALMTTYRRASSGIAVEVWRDFLLMRFALVVRHKAYSDNKRPAYANSSILVLLEKHRGAVDSRAII